MLSARRALVLTGYKRSHAVATRCAEALMGLVIHVFKEDRAKPVQAEG
jgi:hypothetical protein